MHRSAATGEKSLAVKVSDGLTAFLLVVLTLLAFGSTAWAGGNFRLQVFNNPDPVTRGESITYTANVTRVSSSGDDNIERNSTLTFPLPANLTFVSLTSSANFTCTTPAVGSSGTVVCTANSDIYLGGGVEVFSLVANSTLDAANTRTLTVTLDNLRETDPSDNTVTTITGVVEGRTPTTTVTTSSQQQSVFGQSVTFTATVTGAGATPTGLLAFFVDGVAGSPITLDGAGQASFTTADLTVGNHTVCANYLGDSANLPSCGALNGGQEVNAGSTTTAVGSSLNPSLPGQSVTFTATVGVTAPAAGTPTGTVTFTIDGTPQAPVALAGSSATLTTSALALGNHTITASYSGDANFDTSASVALTQNVGLTATTTALSSSLNPSGIGQAVTFTATVSGASGSPDGLVTFLDGATTLGSGTLDGAGIANLTISDLTVGSHNITASYGGNADFAASTSSVLAQAVTTITTTTVLASSLNPSEIGQAVTFTATVDAEFVTPTGSVTFSIDGAAQPAVSLSGGMATLTTSTLAGGPHSITASYSGDATFAASSASALSQQVNLKQGNITIRVATDGPDGLYFFTSPIGPLNVTVTTTQGSGETAALAIDAGVVAVTAGDLSAQGIGLASISCSDADSQGDVATRTATITLAAGESVICTFQSLGSRQRTTDILDEFLAERADLILANQPDTDRRIDRLNGVTAPPPNPGAAFANYVPGMASGSAITASTSLSAINALTGTGDVNNPIDIWFKGTYLSLDRGAGDGNFGLATFGADYLVSSNLLVGGFVQIDRLSLSNPGSAIDGTGWIAGPYATARLSPNLYLDVVAGAGTSSNSVSPYATYEDDFDTTRYMAQATLKGEWTRDAWTFSPAARLGYFSDASQAYTDSLGVVIPDVSVALGQFAISPEVSYRFVTESDLIIDTRLKFEGIANFAEGADASGFGDVRGRVEAGVDIAMSGGARIGFAASYDGIGSDDLTAVGGSVKVSIPLN